MSIDVNVQNDLVIVTETTEDIVVNVSNAVGPAGPAGVGVPVGGATNQVLKKLSATNFDTYWAEDGGGIPYSGATGDVNLGTHRILAQNATIASNGSGDTALINHTSGSGIALNITKGGNGEGLYVNKTSGSGNAATIIGTLNATSLVKSGGTSSQFLKADGSVDSSVYLTGITSGNVTTALGFTPVPTTRNLTINGVTQDLSADRTYTVSATPAGSNTQIQYNNSGAFGASAGLVYDGTQLTVSGTNSSAILANGGITLSNTGGAANTPVLSFGVGQATTSQIIVGNSTFSFAGGSNSLNLYHNLAGPIVFFNGSGNPPSRRFSVLTNGRVVVGDATTASTTFVVNGAFNGDGITINGSQVNLGFSIANSGAGANTWGFNNAGTGSSQTAGTLAIGSTNNAFLLFATGNVVLGPNNSSDAGFKLDVNGTARVSGAATFSSSVTATSFIPNGTTIPTIGMYSSAANTLDFSTNTGNKLTILSTGEVGVNTVTPTAKMTVSNSSGDRHFLAIGTAPSISLGESDTSPQYYTTLGTATQTNNFVQGAAAGDFVITNRGSVSGNLLFCAGSGSTNERMRITSGGNVLINTTTDAGFKLDVNGTARVSGDATFSSSVTASSLIKSGGTSSQFLKADGSVDSSAYITGITSGNVTTALGFTPVTNARLISTTSPIVGGGDLSADRTISIPAATGSVSGHLTSTDWTTFNNKQNALGFTPVPTTRTITINGTSLDLSADRSYTVAGGSSVTIGTSAADVLSASAGEITADDAGSDKIVFWDDSENKLTYLTVGDGVEINGTTITAQDWFVIAASDETSNLIAGTGKVYFRMPYAGTLLAVRASVNTASTGSTIIVDINENGTSILSTKLSIDATEKTSTTAAVPAVISDSALADDSEMSIDIDQIGSTILGKGLKVYLKVRRN